METVVKIFCICFWGFAAIVTLIVGAIILPFEILAIGSNNKRY